MIPPLKPPKKPAEPLTALQPDGRVLIIATEPSSCPKCKRMAYFLVNANGSTTCVDCAPEHGAPP